MSASEARDDRPLMAMVNDEIQRLHGSLGLLDSEFFCECGRTICKERVTLSRDEFATLRAQSLRLIAAAHRNVGEAGAASDPHEDAASFVELDSEPNEGSDRQERVDVPRRERADPRWKAESRGVFMAPAVR